MKEANTEYEYFFDKNYSHTTMFGKKRNIRINLSVYE